MSADLKSITDWLNNWEFVILCRAYESSPLPQQPTSTRLGTWHAYWADNYADAEAMDLKERYKELCTTRAIINYSGLQSTALTPPKAPSATPSPPAKPVVMHWIGTSPHATVSRVRASAVFRAQYVALSVEAKCAGTVDMWAKIAGRIPFNVYEIFLIRPLLLDHMVPENFPPWSEEFISTLKPQAFHNPYLTTGELMNRVMDGIRASHRRRSEDVATENVMDMFVEVGIDDEMDVD
ncbi:hypothetical protein P280DRAFT_514389 [Massarina eburnea CBS 473.64]|uniref:Uncharacterized protein n=1 Tax=Massarina eburnea CBS 473.64 TaxID=1395130 RepID=A0A6A6SCN8_9PLEO|nr:hypothetical protein P280DRAFT_514389 [Massarina eburnea CBS 473.64]